LLSHETGKVYIPGLFQKLAVKKLLTFLKEARDELKRVNWPTRKELKDSTKVVILSTLLLVLFIGLIDFVLSKVLNLILG
jgi:preprotein translocase subunit SecE